MAGAAALGIDLLKGDIRWTVLEGTLSAPVYVRHGRTKYNPELTRPQMANDFSHNFLELIAEYKPKAIGYRVNHKVDRVDQAAYLIMPFGILAAMCFSKDIELVEYNNNSYTAKRFGLGRGVDPAEACSQLLGSPAPHWDKNQKNSAMSAWGCLNV